jgi:phosphatidylglycerophosphate synthase
MFDKQIFAWTEKPAIRIAAALRRRGVGADLLTVVGFAAGLIALPLLAGGFFLPALVFILANRVCDGLDGVIARLDGTSDRGAFLDVALDFFFYASVPFGFALADPSANALAAAFLLFGFIGTGSSFLALAVLAEKRGSRSADFPTKGIYYLGGLTEGAETVLAFILMCLFPASFALIAYCFGALCMITTVMRWWWGWRLLAP